MQSRAEPEHQHVGLGLLGRPVRVRLRPRPTRPDGTRARRDRSGTVPHRRSSRRSAATESSQLRYSRSTRAMPGWSDTGGSTATTTSSAVSVRRSVAAERQRLRGVVATSIGDDGLHAYRSALEAVDDRVLTAVEEVEDQRTGEPDADRDPGVLGDLVVRHRCRRRSTGPGSPGRAGTLNGRSRSGRCGAG